MNDFNIQQNTNENYWSTQVYNILANIIVVMIKKKNYILTQIKI